MWTVLKSSNLRDFIHTVYFSAAVEPPIGLTSTPASSQTINKVTPFGKSLLRQNGRETSPIRYAARLLNFIILLENTYSLEGP